MVSKDQLLTVCTETFSGIFIEVIELYFKVKSIIQNFSKPIHTYSHISIKNNPIHVTYLMMQN